jgi:hypothetical protein
VIVERFQNILGIIFRAGISREVSGRGKNNSRIAYSNQQDRLRPVSGIGVRGILLLWLLLFVLLLL